MKKNDFMQGTQFQNAIETMQLLKAASVKDDPYYRFMWEVGLSPLQGGKIAARSQAQLQRMLFGRALANQFRPPSIPPLPDVDQRRALLIGLIPGIWKKFILDMQWLTRHFLVQGPTGSGKTSFIFMLIFQLLRKGISIFFQDHKNEGRRLLANFPDAIIMPIDRIRENLFEPVGDANTYYSTFWNEFRKPYDLRKSTASKLFRISMRIAAGLHPGDPYPSPKDIEHIVRKLAETEKNDSFVTAANALASFNAILGRAAYVRKGPRPDRKWQLVVYECRGLAPDFIQFFSAMQLYRSQTRSYIEGHSEALRRAYISDECMFELGKEMMSESGSLYTSPGRRRITQVRSIGEAFIGGVQSISTLDPIVPANMGSFLCLKTQNDADDRICGQLLNLPDERTPELRTMQFRTAFFRTFAYPETVKLLLPKINMPDYMSDEELAARMKPAWDWLNANTVFSNVKDDVGTPISYVEILGEKSEQTAESDDPDLTEFKMLQEHEQFLREIVQAPDASVAEHYRHLGWSSGKGNRVKEELLTNGIIYSERQSCENGRPRKILAITEKGKALFHDLV